MTGIRFRNSLLETLRDGPGDVLSEVPSLGAARIEFISELRNERPRFGHVPGLVMSTRFADLAIARPPVGLLVVFVVFVCGPSGSRVVPADRSLSSAQYSDLGVPELDGTWSRGEYAAALDALVELDRRLLPRYGSPRSGAFFERLVLGQEAYIEAVWPNIEPEEEPLASAGDLPSPAKLYGWNHVDGLFFDRELAEIYSSLTRQRIGELASMAEQDAVLAELLARAADETQRRRILTASEGRPLAKEGTEILTVYLFAALVQISTDEATRPDTRRALRDQFVGLVPRAVDHLSPERVLALSDAMRSVAANSKNAEIRADLRELAESIAH